MTTVSFTSRVLLVPAVLAALALGACQNNGQGPEMNKQNVGTLLGGIGGAVLGAQFGKGTGQLIGVAAGALAGAYLGNQIGSSLDKADKAAMEQASHKATTAPIGPRSQERVRASHQAMGVPSTRRMAVVRLASLMVSQIALRSPASSGIRAHSRRT